MKKSDIEKKKKSFQLNRLKKEHHRFLRRGCKDG
tara:strand:+ start:1743 stop:1844 length:102 start_codon:yes stop_codon:yes gene_type:complete